MRACCRQRTWCCNSARGVRALSPRGAPPHAIKGEASPPSALSHHRLHSVATGKSLLPHQRQEKGREREREGEKDRERGRETGERPRLHARATAEPRHRRPLPPMSAGRLWPPVVTTEGQATLGKQKQGSRTRSSCGFGPSGELASSLGASMELEPRLAPRRRPAREGRPRCWPSLAGRCSEEEEKKEKRKRRMLAPMASTRPVVDGRLVSQGRAGGGLSHRPSHPWIG